MTIIVTGATLTGCTIGPYIDPYILFGTANNQIGISFNPLVTLASTANNQVGITYGPPLVTLASSTNNQIPINTRGA